jgi:phage tail-like protein
MAKQILSRLTVINPDRTQRVVELMHSPVNIGRASTNDVILPDETVSHQHAQLCFEGGQISLQDLGSKNGTHFKQTRLDPTQLCPLGYGDMFKIGPYWLRLEPPPQAEAESAGRAASVAAVENAAGDLPPVPPPPEAPPASAQFSSADDGLLGLAPDGSRYLQYLPPIYHEHDFLRRFLAPFEGVLGPIEQLVDNFDLYLDPNTAPEFFLNQLAAWLGLTLNENWPLAKRRAIVAQAADLYRKRGTRQGLCQYLKIYTDSEPEISEPEDRPHHFRVVLRLPASQAIDRDTIERMIQAYKPAHTTYQLEIIRAS